MEPNIQTAIVALAAKQQNNITWDQLLAVGLGAKAVAYRTRTGRYFRVHDCVYSLGHPPQTPHQKAMAAVLACGAGAALSHQSAMALWGLRSHWPSTLEVTVTTDRRPRGIQVHLSRTLTRADVTRHFSIPVTNPARTLNDCAPDLTDAALARAVNDALLSPYLTRSQLAEFLTRHPNKRLQPFVETADGPTRSEFEDAFLAFCDQHYLPRPKMNTIVAGREVDAYFPDERLIVELDGWRFHSGRRSFEDDRVKDANALVLGIATLRLTWDRMTQAPEQEARRLWTILQARRR
jgi:very-short-patch-repair endonuclease